MNKKFIFSFYLDRHYGDEINKIHFNCLRHFKDCFDEADISLIVDDDYNRDDLLDAEKTFLSIFVGKNVSFSVVKNNEFRESRVFYDKIATRLKDEDIVFFGHNKGISNVFKFDREQIYQWVAAMYYFSLSDMKDVENRLVNEKYYSYGSFLTKNDEPERCNKYGWYYIGTFFWLNCKKLWQYMENNEIKLPELYDRFYSEEFLGNIIPTWPLIFTASVGNRYLVNCGDFYRHTTEYINAAYGDFLESYNDFYKNVALS